MFQQVQGSNGFLLDEINGNTNPKRKDFQGGRQSQKNRETWACRAIRKLSA
jgi:hypothetical protein